MGILLIYVWLQMNGNSDRQSYEGASPYLPVSFKYPVSWMLREDQGKIDHYSQAIILAPKKPGWPYTAAFVVRGSPLKSARGRFETPEELKQNFVSHLYKDPRVLKESTLRLKGTSSIDLTVSYTFLPIRHKGFNAQPVPVKNRILFAQNNGILYELSYSADEREFESHSAEFSRLLKSLRFVTT